MSLAGKAHRIPYHRNFIECQEKWIREQRFFISKLEAEIKKAEEEIEFRKFQIATAIRNKKEAFAETAYLQKFRKKK